MSRYAYQNLNERIAKLKAHLKTRRGRRDLIALGTLVDIRMALEGRLTYDKCLEIMKTYYSPPDMNAVIDMSSPFFAFVKKDPGSDSPRRYVQPVEASVPKYRCAECDTLQDITPNGVDPATSNKRQRVAVHPDKRNPPDPVTGYPICNGSGKDV